jgi:c-di-GMP-binding flagellar brake protein YcgR
MPDQRAETFDRCQPMQPTAGKEMSLVAFEKQDSVVVGQPMPFSVYDGGGKLLVAKSSPLTSERMRDVVLSQGVYMSPSEGDSGAIQLPIPPPTVITGILADLRDGYAESEERSRFGLRISRDERSESYASFVVGVINEKRYLILSTPVSKGGLLVPIAKDEVWMIRLFNATTVFRFKGRVVKVALDPVPHLHIELPENIERRMVRRQPRALASLGAALHRPNGPAAVIVDISTNGVRLAVEATTSLEKDAVIPICTTVAMMDREFPLTLTGRITATFGATDANFPSVNFYGVQLEEVNDNAALVLHAYVHEQLTQELDRLGRVLAIESVSDNGLVPMMPKKKSL